MCFYTAILKSLSHHHLSPCHVEAAWPHRASFAYRSTWELGLPNFSMNYFGPCLISISCVQARQPTMLLTTSQSKSQNSCSRNQQSTNFEFPTYLWFTGNPCPCSLLLVFSMTSLLMLFQKAFSFLISQLFFSLQPFLSFTF